MVLVMVAVSKICSRSSSKGEKLLVESKQVGWFVVNIIVI